jgi:hypothetical protein
MAPMRRYVLETAHLRNERRGGGERVPRDALDRMAAALEPPDPDKRPFEVGLYKLWMQLTHGLKAPGFNP